jgi:hypothetical protein
MNVFVRLRLVRVILTIAVAFRALLWGVAAGLTFLAGTAASDLATPLPVPVRGALLALAIAASLAVAGAVAWRDRAVLTLQRVALWVEACFPELEYALVTAIDTGRAEFVAPVAALPWLATTRARAARALRLPLAIAVVSVLVVLLLPRGAVARARSPRAGDALFRSQFRRAVGGSRLTPLVARIIPPAYTHGQTVAIDEPSEVAALSGSTLTIAGRGSGTGISAHFGTDSVVQAIDWGERWEMAIHVGQQPMMIEFSDRSFRRVVAVESVPDSVPVVTLRAPPRDSVVRAARCRIAIAAGARDDYGISAAWFEFIVSSGEGETFTFRSGKIGLIEPKNARDVSWTATLSLDSLALNPGDIVHVRAMARDANTVSGPGVGASDTRTLRVARAGEYDSTAVEATDPADADKSVISERMLISLAESLERRRSALSRDAFVGESRAVAVDQRSLRRAVGEIVFTRLGGDPTGEEHSGDESPSRARTMEQLLARADSATTRTTDPIDFEGGESPVVAVNRPLLEAYNAMWDATTALEVGQPAQALPHMRAALAAIQRARQAERIYLRGSMLPVVIDIDKVRLTGKDKGASSARRALAPIDSAARRRAERFARIVELSARAPDAAVDSLLVLRIDALDRNPSFAAALGDAVTAMRQRRSDDAARALRNARRVLSGAPLSHDSLSRWGIVP